MSDQQKQTRLERIQNRLKNNPIVAWVIVATSLVLAISALIPATKSIFRELDTSEKVPPLNITLSAYDPRFGPIQESGGRMNWGGGSQSLFIETSVPAEQPNPPSGVYEYSSKIMPKLLTRLDRDNSIVNVWEVIPGGDGEMRINVSAVYDAAKGAPTCVVMEWGLLVNEATLPSNGIYLKYGGLSGAYMAPTGGEVRIGNSMGSYPITLWMDEDSNKWDSKQGKYVFLLDEDQRPNKKPNELIQYLTPGEPAFLHVSINNTEEDVITHQPRPHAARIIKVYARILVEGKEWVILSKNAVQAVTLDGSSDWHLNRADDEEIENIRKRAYVTRN